MTTTTTKRAPKAKTATVPASDSTTAPTDAPKNPRNAAYSLAERRLRDAHPDEFQALLKEETEKLGLVYKPRISAAEREQQRYLERKAKAQAKIDALIEEFGEDVVSQPVEVLEPDASATPWS